MLKTTIKEDPIHCEIVQNTTGNPQDNAPISSTNPLEVNLAGREDPNNSTDTPLLSGQTFIGTSTDLSDYASIGLLVFTDQNSANDGLIVQYSYDEITWYDGEAYTIPANKAKFFTPPKQSKYYRVKYTNNGVDQTDFHIHTTLSKTPIKWSSHNLADNLNDDDDGELTLSVLKLRTAQDQYVSGAATSSGNFKVSLEELESGVSEDSNTTLRTTNIMIDEYDNVNRTLGDNGFKGAAIVIPPEHHEIHCGDSYTAHHVEDLGNGQTHNYLITTPDWGNPVVGDDSFGNQAIKVAHFVGEVSGEAETTVYFYESPTVTDVGNPVPVNNRNRNSANVDYLTISEGATISATGTELEHSQFGSGRGVGGSINRTDEWILKNNTTYLVRVVNNTATTNYHTIRFQYYVHPGI